MKKIININFHGRVVPIEESAYEILQQYVESLRRYFANEEGRDEIVNDIENRFAELFSENLKKGSTCITDADVNTIITSMGRPEDFEQEDMAAPAGAAAGTGSYSGSGGQNQGGSPGGGGYSSQPGYSASSGSSGSSGYSTEEPRRLYRSDNDKILGGVCAGLANFLRLDPAIVRIIFAVITLGGFGLGFILYLILWVVLPTKTLAANVRKRLYRNPDDRMLGGVASGLAAYFHIDVWIPRLIFALPLITGIFASIFHRAWYGWDRGAVFFTGGFGGSLFITYIILWMVLPEAVSASEKLEMRGEKVDLESIKNTVKSDLENFNKKAREVGSQMKERFQQVGEDVKANTRNFATEAAPVARKVGHGIGHAIGVLFKAFFLFIAGTIAFALTMALIGLIFSGASVLTFKNYVFSGFWQNALAWTAFVLFLLIPVIALLTWLIRRIIGVRSKNHYLGYTFAGLWVIGLFCFIGLVGSVISNYRSRQRVQEEVSVSQPPHGKMIVKISTPGLINDDDDDWFDMGWENNGVFYHVNADSMTLNTIRVDLLKSPDSLYHVQVIRSSRGSSARVAHDLAEQISFPVRQADSVLYLPYGFTVSRDQHFRNQQVLVAVAIPVGRRIFVDKGVASYRWFNMNLNRRHFRWVDNWGRKWKEEDWNDDSELESDWGTTYHWETNREYVMTADGLVRTDRKATDGDEERRDNNGSEQRGYRYHRRADSVPHKAGKDSAATKTTTMAEARAMGEAMAVRATGVANEALAMNVAQPAKAAKAAKEDVESPAYLLTMLF
ncbi:MAG: PspC domain-containing protein [Bacteroidota bacterium]|nr:PspC domain-containing protein [Bacteroidota bacterium]MDP4216313.1 PspC domain-containing protein [Bacteroidota bacterium]MDP4258463.1 PspC domain-containing protein [Bacteroidota bacterium]